MRKEKKDKERHDEPKGRGGQLHKELKAGVSDTAAAGHESHASGAGTTTTVITLAGENKGASMKVSHAAEAESKDKQPRRAVSKLDNDGQQQGAKGMTAFVNSNVQVVNNSLVLQSSCDSCDHGVHLKLSTESNKKGAGEEAGGGKSGAVAAAAKKKK